MALLTSEESARVSAAVKNAERATGGEIVTAIIGESDDYSARELLFAVLTGMLAFVVSPLYIPAIRTMLERRFWVDVPDMTTLAVGIVSVLAGVLAYVLFQVPALDRLIVGRRVMAEAVRHRAMRHFAESSVYDTIDRTGVLLFISVLERRVELIADRGINEKVTPDTWDRIVSSLIRGIRDGRTADAMVNAVGEIGTVLSEHVPQRTGDRNELADGPVQLGRKS